MLAFVLYFQANKKFNDGLAENSKLREQIDHMRTEREIFEGLYKKLEKVSLDAFDNHQPICDSCQANKSSVIRSNEVCYFLTIPGVPKSMDV